MLTAIKQFIRKNLRPQDDDPAPARAHRARLAAAALLVEVTRSDETISAEERRALLQSLDRKFELSGEEAQGLITLAEAAAANATDLYQFTSEINRGFDSGQKIRLIEELWRAALADAVLNAHEEHLIRKVADLIHVPHAAYINAKLRVMGKSRH